MVLEFNVLINCGSHTLRYSVIIFFEQFVSPFIDAVKKATNILDIFKVFRQMIQHLKFCFAHLRELLSRKNISKKLFEICYILSEKFYRAICSNRLSPVTKYCIVMLAFIRTCFDLSN